MTNHHCSPAAESSSQNCLFHGSGVPNLTQLQPLSKLHQSNQRVAYFASSVPYVLFYIWDSEKTNSSRKWVTAWLKDGIAYYEEQFPGQLKAFYEGVRGYLYSVLPDEMMQPVQNREGMFFSTAPVSVYRVTEIEDVYQELLRHEQEGRFQLLRFEDAAPEKQTELVNRIATYIRESNLLDQGNEHARFMRRYFLDAWEKAEGDAT